MKVHFFDNDRALADETWDVPADAEDPRAWALRRAAAYVEQRLGLARPVPVTVRDSEGEWDVLLFNGGAAIDATPVESAAAARGGRGAGPSRAPGPLQVHSRRGQQRDSEALPRHREQTARGPRNGHGQERGAG